MSGQPMGEEPMEHEQHDRHDHVSAGGKEFYFVAGLAVINSAISLFGGDFSLIFGLSSALIATYMFPLVPAAAITVVLAAVFAGLGFMATKGKAWAFIVGIALYLLDAAAAAWAILVVGDDAFLLDLGAHAVVLWFMARALLALRAGSVEPVMPQDPAEEQRSA